MVEPPRPLSFAVLGTIQAFVGGQPVPIGSPRQRAVFVVLLCHRGRPVSVDRLADIVWQGTPPRSARSNIQTYVSGLRDALGSADRVVFEAGGYRLRVQFGELDCDRFESLAGLAGDTTSVGDHSTAARVLREALDLWRGSPYTGASECDEIDVVRTEVARLHELYLTTLEAWFSAELELGRGAAIVPELVAAVAQHPYRERLRGQLMIALHRSGRTAEALDAYRETRRVLSADIGIEPGSDLRELERRILVDDPGLRPATWPASLQERAGLVPPMEVPASSPVFVGRDAQVATLVAALTSRDERAGPLVCSIDGPPGVGKSALAVVVARLAGEAYPDGLLYVDLHGATSGVPPRTPHSVLARMLRSLGYPERDIPIDADEAAAQFRSVTAGRRVLVVLDDAVDASQVRRLVASGPGCVTIITSRARLTALDVSTRIALAHFDEREGQAMLARIAEPGSLTDPEVAIRIVELCGGLPLALRIAGGRLAARDGPAATALADELADAIIRLDVLHDADLSVRSCVDVGIEHVGSTSSGPSAQRLFGLLGLLKTPAVPAWLVPVLAGIDDRDARRALDALRDAQLVDLDEVRAAHLHDLTRLCAHEYAVEHLSGPDRSAALTRVVHAYVATGRRCARPHAFLRAGRHPADVHVADAHGLSLEGSDAIGVWVDRERSNLLPIAQLALDPEVGGPLVCFALVEVMFSLLFDAGWYHDLADLNRLVLDELDRFPDATREAIASHDLAVALRMIGATKDAKASAERSLRAAEQAADPEVESLALNGLSTALLRNGEVDASINVALRLTSLCRELGEPAETAAAVHNLGVKQLNAGRYGDALSALRESLEIGQHLGDEFFTGLPHFNCGCVLLETGDLADAASHLRTAIPLFDESGRRVYAAASRWYLSEVYRRQGRAAHSRATLRRALRALCGIGLMTGQEAQALLDDPNPPKPECFTRL